MHFKLPSPSPSAPCPFLFLFSPQRIIDSTQHHHHHLHSSISRNPPLPPFPPCPSLLRLRILLHSKGLLHPSFSNRYRPQSCSRRPRSRAVEEASQASSGGSYKFHYTLVGESISPAFQRIQRIGLVVAIISNQGFGLLWSPISNKYLHHRVHEVSKHLQPIDIPSNIFLRLP